MEQQKQTKQVWIPLPYFFFSKPGIKILLREENSDRLILLYMQLLCMSIPNDGKVIYSPSCPGFTPYTLAVSLEGNFQAKEIGLLLPILKKRALVDYEDPKPEEDLENFKINLTIIDFNSDFPLLKDAIAAEREAKLEDQNDETVSKKKTVSKIHNQLTQQLIDSEFITNQDRSLPDYDAFFTSMTEKFDKTIGLDRMKGAVDEILAKYKTNPTKITAKSKWFFKCYENLLSDLRQQQVFSGSKSSTSSKKAVTKDDDYDAWYLGGDQ